jgi:ribA/ribD-fused uncharacterized protein
MYHLFLRGPLSNWHGASFTGMLWDGFERQFENTEQYMMAGKALLFGDVPSMDAIMHSPSPKEQKALGRLVRHFDKDVWDRHARNLVYVGTSLKFEQDVTSKLTLLGTEAVLAEANPYDKVWGIALSETDPKAQDSCQWQGTNWLGQVLTQLRHDLRTATPEQIEKKRMVLLQSIRDNISAPMAFLTPASDYN